MNSPCTKVCVMDPQRELCKGCYRSLDEIARWGGMSDTEREQILSALPERANEQKGLDVAEIPVPPLP